LVGGVSYGARGVNSALEANALALGVFAVLVDDQGADPQLPDSVHRYFGCPSHPRIFIVVSVLPDGRKIKLCSVGIVSRISSAGGASLPRRKSRQCGPAIGLKDCSLSAIGEDGICAAFQRAFGAQDNIAAGATWPHSASAGSRVHQIPASSAGRGFGGGIAVRRVTRALLDFADDHTVQVNLVDGTGKAFSIVQSNPSPRADDVLLAS
jgi:hypothetical protein